MLCPVCPIDVNALSSILVCYKLCAKDLIVSCNCLYMCGTGDIIVAFPYVCVAVGINSELIFACQICLPKKRVSIRLT